MDVSLADLITQKFQSRRGRNRGNKPRGFRGVQRGGGINKRRNNNFGRQVAGQWKHDLFDAMNGQTNNVGNVGGSAKLHIANLDFGVNDDDIRELFKEFGIMKKASVHYDRSGRSLGTAEVIYSNRNSAAKAKSHYNNVPLDGRPMNIQIVGDVTKSPGINVVSRVGQRPFRAGRGRGASSGFRGRGGGMGGRRRGGRGAGAGGGGAMRQNKRSVTKEQLDKELQDYMSQPAN